VLIKDEVAVHADNVGDQFSGSVINGHHCLSPCNAKNVPRKAVGPNPGINAYCSIDREHASSQTGRMLRKD